MAQNILQNILELIIEEYNIPLEQKIYKLRYLILNNDKENNNNNNTKYCFICHKSNKNLKLRQINNLTRVTDEIITSQLMCDKCYTGNPLL